MSSNISEDEKKKSIIKRSVVYTSTLRILDYIVAVDGIVFPKVEKMTHYQAMQEVKGQALTFEKTIKLSQDDKIINIINYKHYNKIIKSKK